MQLFSKLHAWTVLLFVSLAMFSAARGQAVTLSVKDAPIETVFSAIEQQTSYNFIYTSEAIAAAKRVSFSVQNASLDQVLTLCFSKQPLTYNISDRHITVRLKSPEPQPPKEKVITGRVSNENGEPVAGVTLLVLPSRQFAFSDANGLFKITARDSDNQIEVSGAEIETQRINIVEQTILNIQVNRKQSVLDEAIVIAYGKTTRRMATGSVSRLTSTEISQQPVSNTLLTLSGRLTGLQVSQGSGAPGSHVTVRLRGQNSLANGNDPLYIIDGVPFPSTMLPTSLTGASITQSPLNNINPLDIESIEVLKDADATAIYGSRAANGVILITTRKGQPGTVRTELTYQSGWSKITRSIPLMNTEQYLTMRREAFANDNVTPTLSNAADLLLWDTTRYTDWQKVLLGHTARSHLLRASISGGNELTQFQISSTYRQETTVYPSEFGEKKFSGHLSLQHTSPDKRFHVSFHSSYSRTNIDLPDQDAFQNINLAPNAPAIFDTDGKLNWENSTWINPFATMKRVFKTKNDNFINNAQLTYSLLPFLKFKTSLGNSLLTTNERNLTPSTAMNPNIAINRISKFSNSTVRTMLAEPQIIFDHQLKDFHIGTLLGATFQYSISQGTSLEASGYTTDNLMHSLAAAADVRALSEIDSRYRYTGALGRINVDYKKKYLLSASARRDGSSRFGPNNRFANFGSVALGWIFSEESFSKKHFPFLSFGKIRGSFGTSGNDQIGDYKYFNSYKPTGDTYLGVNTFEPTRLYNPEYGWEEVRKAELSIDLGFMKDRLLFSTNLYDNRTTNQLLNYGLPSHSGFTGVLRNMPAVIRNYGVEFELTYSILQNTNWKWKANFNLSIPRNKLVSFDDLARSPYSNLYRTGQSLFIVRRYAFNGIDNSTGVYVFEDINKDGVISSPSDNTTVLFTGQQYFGGLNQQVSFKNFALGVFVQFVRQKNANSWVFLFNRPGLAFNQPVWVLDRWQQPGDDAVYQRYTISNSAANSAHNYYRSSEAAFDDASFVRLKTVHASWTPTLPKKIGTLSSTIFLQAQNLLTITNYKGADPETKTVLPPLRTITAGIQLKF